MNEIDLSSLGYGELELLKTKVKVELRDRKTPTINDCPRCGNLVTRAGFTPNRLRAIEGKTAGKTYRQIGDEMGISLERARQLFVTGMIMLKRIADNSSVARKDPNGE